MGQLVKLVTWVWGRHGQGVWKFDVDHTEVKYDVAVRENESYIPLLEMVKGKFQLRKRLLTSEILTGKYLTIAVEGIIKDL